MQAIKKIYQVAGFVILIAFSGIQFSGNCQNIAYIRIDDRDCPNCNVPVSYCKKISPKYDKIVVFRSSACRFSKQLAAQYLDKPYQIICSDSLFNSFDNAVNSVIIAKAGPVTVKYSVRLLNLQIIEKINRLADMIDFSKVTLPDSLGNRTILACNQLNMFIIDELFNNLYQYDIEKQQFKICPYFTDQKKALFNEVFGNDSKYNELTTNELILKHGLSTDINLIEAACSPKSVFFIAGFYKLFHVHGNQPYIMLAPVNRMIQYGPDNKFSFVGRSDINSFNFSAINDSIFVFSSIKADTLLSATDKVFFKTKTLHQYNSDFNDSLIAAFPLHKIFSKNNFLANYIFAYPYALNVNTFELYHIPGKEYFGSVLLDLNKLTVDNFFDQVACAISIKENYLRILVKNKHNKYKMVYYHIPSMEVEKTTELNMQFAAESNFCNIADIFFICIAEGPSLQIIKIPDISE